MSRARYINTFLGGIALILLCGAIPCAADSHGIPYAPRGTMEASGDWIARGGKPELSWRIDFPKTLADVVSLDAESGALVTRVPLRVRMNVIGVGTATSRDPHRVGLWASLAGGNWELLKDTTAADVRPAKPVFDRVLPASTSVFLAARAYDPATASWSETRSTERTGAVPGLVESLGRGALLPGPVRALPAPFLDAFVSPVAPDGAGSSVLVGPKELLIFFELGTDDPADDRFDLQDVVVLVSFDEV